MDDNNSRMNTKKRRTAGIIVIGLVVLGVVIALNFLGLPRIKGGTPVAENTRNVTSEVPQVLPNAPINLRATQLPIFDVLMGWDDVSNNEDGFRIYRRRIDVLSEPARVGDTGPNQTEFHDTDTYCGAVYQYVVSSYNRAGESPSSVCWQVQMPDCPTSRSIDLATGLQQGYNFQAAAFGAASDFYLNFLPDGQLDFLADQDGQLGLVDLGEQTDTPLHHLDLPTNVLYSRDGVGVQANHNYVAQARDGQSLIVFDTAQPAAPLAMNYILWTPSDIQVEGECSVPFSPPVSYASAGSGVTTSGGSSGPSNDGGATTKPGGPCVTGDGLCDPSCVAASSDGAPIPTPTLGVPTTEDLRSTVRDCTVIGLTVYSDTGSPQAGFNALNACLMERAGMSFDDLSNLLHGTYPTPNQSPAEQAPIPVPRYSAVDYDCASVSCVPDDGLCNPLCGVDTGLSIALGNGITLTWVDTDGDGTYDQHCSLGQCQPISAAERASLNHFVFTDTNGDGTPDSLCGPIPAGQSTGESTSGGGSTSGEHPSIIRVNPSTSGGSTSGEQPRIVPVNPSTSGGGTSGGSQPGGIVTSPSSRVCFLIVEPECSSPLAPRTPIKITVPPIDQPTPATVPPVSAQVPQQTPVVTEIVTQPPVEGADGTLCGDGICQAGESPDWCGDCVEPSGGESGGKKKGGGNPAPVCGDAVCNGTETCWTCPNDCGPC